MNISINDNLSDKELDDLKARWASEATDIQLDTTGELADKENANPLEGRYQSKIEKFKEKPLEPWDMSTRGGIEAKIQASFEQFDKLIEDSTVSIKQLMMVINKLRVQGAALARRVEKEEVSKIEEGCDTSLSNMQKELNKTGPIWTEVAGTIVGSLAGLSGQDKTFGGKVSAEQGPKWEVGLAGMGAALGGTSKMMSMASAALQEGYRTRSGALVQREQLDAKAIPTSKTNSQLLSKR